MRVAVTGGKGGTGKSTIATALAYRLSRDNHVLLVDADVDNPNDHILLSMKRKFVRNVEQIIPEWDLEKCIKCGRCSEVCKTNSIVFVKERYPIFVEEQCNGCGACMIVCPVKAIKKSKKIIGRLYLSNKGNLSLISGEIHPGQPLSENIVSALKEYASELEESYDMILIDTAAGTHCPVITALKGCDVALAVTEPTPFGAHDLELILRLLKILKIPSKIVLNRCDIGRRNLIERVAKKFNADIIAEIPYDKNILLSFSQGKPIEKYTDKVIEALEL
ncbi:MAG: P-loop ATPase [Candidatus Aenigmatarchaeota archaeon]|nr:MAG: P-loop ATPase [Candidatus Aenigmarchaeota archaeon]